MLRILWIACLTGCVAKGRYEVSQVQLGATRTALSAREAASREALEEARAREEALQHRLAEVEGLASLQKEHAVELEGEIDRLAAANAEHVLLDQEECALPEEPTEGDSPLPPTPGVLRTVHVEASLVEVQAALAANARSRRAEIEREHKHASVEAAFEVLVSDGLAIVQRTPTGSVVRVLVAKLFNENRATVSPLGLTVIERTAASLEALRDHDLEVVGHTDDVPSNSVLHASNWELGFAYAASMVRGLEEAGIRVPMTASSRAGKNPLVEPVDKEARRLNRRVELHLTPRRVELSDEPADEPETDLPEESDGSGGKQDGEVAPD